MEPSQEFYDDFEQTRTQLNELFIDLFQGEKIEKIAKNFLKKHGDYIKKVPYYINSKYPNMSLAEIIDEDLEILRSDLYDESKVPKNMYCCGIIYCYAAGGCYLRTSYNNILCKKNEDHKEAVDLARVALRYNPVNQWGNVWYAAALGYQLDTVKAVKEKINLSRNFKHCNKRLIEIIPDDALGYNLLGRYHFHSAGLNWVERQVVKQMLTNDKLEESTYELAESLFLKAHERKKEWLSNGFWMARTLLARKRPMEEVKKWIDHASSCKAQDPVTVSEERELEELKDKLKLSN